MSPQTPLTLCSSCQGFCSVSTLLPRFLVACAHHLAREKPRHRPLVHKDKKGEDAAIGSDCCPRRPPGANHMDTRFQETCRLRYWAPCFPNLYRQRFTTLVIACQWVPACHVAPRETAGKYSRTTDLWGIQSSPLGQCLKRLPYS